MRDEVKKHIEDSLAKIRVVFEKAAERIESIPADGKSKIPGTTLAAEVGKEFGVPGPTMYPTMLFLYKDYPDTICKKGAHGGIYRVAPKTDSADEPVATIDVADLDSDTK